jgi:hypothetical protein
MTANSFSGAVLQSMVLNDDFYRRLSQSDVIISCHFPRHTVTRRGYKIIIIMLLHISHERELPLTVKREWQHIGLLEILK